MKKLIGLFYVLACICLAASVILLLMTVISLSSGSRFWTQLFIYFVCALGGGLSAFISYSVTKACWIYIEKNEVKEQAPKPQHFSSQKKEKEDTEWRDPLKGV